MKKYVEFITEAGKFFLHQLAKRKSDGKIGQIDYIKKLSSGKNLYEDRKSVV